MTESLRALLAGAIDYAGMFPPAALPLEQALAKYREHRRGPAAWMLGRFLCTAKELSELAGVYHREPHGWMAMIIHGAVTSEASLADVYAALTRITAFPKWSVIDSLELRLSVHLLSSANVQLLLTDIQVVAGKITDAGLGPMTLYFELARTGAPQTIRESQGSVRNCVEALAEFNRTAKSSNLEAGFKLRCGGAEPSAVPSPPDVAIVICACRDAGVFWKATAGLHHPFRHFDPALGMPVHGFINLLTAAVMADVHRLEAERVQAIIEDDDPWHFRFTNEALAWHDLSATVSQITAARERSLRSFGSCSIDEPWKDLTVLGLV